jgi:hypothetical protein
LFSRDVSLDGNSIVVILQYDRSLLESNKRLLTMHEFCFWRLTETVEWMCFAVGIGKEEVTVTSHWIKGVLCKKLLASFPGASGICGGLAMAICQSSLLTPLRPQRWSASHPSFVAHFF